MNIIISEDGIYNPDTCSVEPDEALRFGHAFASLFGRNIAVGYDSENCHPSIYALFSGILSAGSNVWNAGRCTVPQLVDAIGRGGFDGGIFIMMSAAVKLVPVFEFGNSLTEKQEQRLSDLFEKGDKSESAAVGRMYDASVMTALYEEEMMSKSEGLKNSASFSVSSSNKLICRLCSEILKKSDTGMPLSEITFSITSDGRKISAYSIETGFVFYEKLVLLCCESLMERGKDIALPYSFPLAAEILAERYERRVVRFNPRTDDIQKIKRLTKNMGFLNDGTLMMIKIISILNEKNASFASLISALPSFTTSSRFISVPNRETELFRKLCGENDSPKEHIAFKDKDTRIIVKPTKSGRGFTLLAESYRMETASELCDIWLTDEEKKE